MLEFILFIWVIVAIICAAIGGNKKMGAGVAFLIGLFLGLIGLIIVLVSENKVENPLPEKIFDEAEQIKKWHDLKMSGAITEEEFNDKKNELLNNR